jgi:glycosyltransferase involved in cell wall biosynthesis
MTSQGLVPYESSRKSFSELPFTSVKASSPQLTLAVQWKTYNEPDSSNAPSLTLPSSSQITYELLLPRHARFFSEISTQIKKWNSDLVSVQAELIARSKTTSLTLRKTFRLQPREAVPLDLDLGSLGGQLVELSLVVSSNDPQIFALTHWKDPSLLWPSYIPPPPIPLKTQPTIVPSSSQKIRTLLFTVNLDLEGAPFSQYELTLGLRGRGEIDPIVISPRDGPLRQRYENQHIPVLIRPPWGQRPKSLSEYQQHIDSLAQDIASNSPDIVYANTLETFFAIDAAHQLRIPSLWNPRESEPWQTYYMHLGDDLSHRALACFQFPYQIIFVSHATAQAFSPLNSHHNFTVIPNGLNPKQMPTDIPHLERSSAKKKLGLSPHDQLILMVGTVTPRKGQSDLISAFKQLPPDLQNQTQILILGDREGPYSQQIHNEISRLPTSLAARIHVHQETHKPFPYYQVADLFVCCSRNESYPRVILEAMHYGLPIITTPVFGIREQVRENENALFYTPGNIPQLREQLQTLLGNPEKQATFGKRSRGILMELTTYDQMLDAYAILFRKAASEKRG